jgi:regulator of replication initiation timing
MKIMTTLKQMTEMKKHMEKNGEESSRLQIVCVQLIDTLGNPKALHQTEPWHRI